MVGNKEDGNADEKYIVDDVQKYCDLFFLEDGDSSFALPGLSELVSGEQIAAVLHERCREYTEQNEPVITFAIHQEIVEIVERMAAGRVLSTMAADGFFDCAWDDKKNCMVFQRKDQPRKYRKRNGRKKR